MWTLPDLQQMDSAQQVQVQKHHTPMNLQKKAITQEAESYGAQGGLAYRAAQIDARLDNEAPWLDRIYNFAPLAIAGSVLPPVIESGAQARVIHADALRTETKAYRMVIPARYVSVMPTWHEFLMFHYRQPKLSEIPPAMLPHNAQQRAWWRDAAAIGWSAGEIQADAEYHNGLARLTRDLTGMIRYRRLMIEGKVQPPMIEQANLGIERDEAVLGRPARMQVGVTLHRITLPAGFASPKDWRVLPR